MTQNVDSPQAPWDWWELAIVSAVVFFVGLVLWWRFLPLPDGDFSFYTEPAYLLAKFGTLVGPGSQYVDLTYQKGIYNYPPGHFLILGAWIKLFGLSDDSLLAFTHLVHSGILILLWALIRFRYACPRLISVLTLISIFPKAPHGRPDLTACALSIAAWLALPSDRNRTRILLSGALTGAVLLVSPAYGIAAVATLLVLIVLNNNLNWRGRLEVASAWGMSAGLLFAGITSAVLSWQHSWRLAYVQFTTNLAVRGAQTNAMPDITLLYTWMFSIFPFWILAVLPAVYVVWATSGRAQSRLRIVTLAFIGATLACFLTNKLQLLMEYHYLFPAKSVFLAVLCSQTRIPPWVRMLPLLMLSAVSWYLFKANYIYLATPLRAEHAKYVENPEPEKELAVDSLYFAKAYQPGHTLNYEPYKNEVFGPQYLKALPHDMKHDLFLGLRESPVKPQVFIVAAYSAAKYGEPTEAGLTCKRADRGFEQLNLAFRKWKLPANPYALLICTTN